MDVEKHELQQKAEFWISKNGICQDMETSIMKYAKLRLQKGRDVDIEHLLHILPSTLGKSIKEHICFPLLKKVPLFQNMDEGVYRTICEFLKPVIYSEKSYIIREGEPLDMVLFITQGVVWTFGSNTSLTNRLQKGDYYGNELIEWRFNSISYNNFPLSIANVKSQTKVEAFALMEIELKHVLYICWPKFYKYNKTNESISGSMNYFAAASLQRGFRRFIKNKKAQENKGQENKTRENEHSIHVNS
ncbi:cyclic nucleotide-gated ion channel 1-like [Humulus lupulus]|uniref:cyclic nucleotide-gated ion channel 1-like n=1 Tax=Humulus lupulus TaxID=3486 RepID=UPI002B415FF4|nr:cyclic nucleotide-gated ion channel 1-like [Humulus lupulus]